MDIIQQVFDMSEVILKTEPCYVLIKDDEIEKLAEQMIEDGKPIFFEDGEYRTGIYIEILKELVASSINYCYWYGTSTIRPNNASSTSMYINVEEVFQDTKTHALNFESRIGSLIGKLSENRFPLLEERKKHLLELCEGRKAERFADMIIKEEHPEKLFHEMVKMFQGFASDAFLKRASLFFIQIYRKFGWYKDDLMTILHVPADYQVPKILNHFGCIEYSAKLEYKIKNSQLITQHSLEELQIRSATVKACTMLSYGTGWNIADVDTYLWTKRGLTDEPFHLTITTDY